MKEAVINLAFLLGSAVCHQLPSHSLFIGGHQLPLCARCTGIHLGFWWGLVFLGSRKRMGLVPNWNFGAILGLGAVLVLADVLSAGFGLRPGSNLTRLLTGLLLGYGLGGFGAGLLAGSAQTSPTKTREGAAALWGGAALAWALGGLILVAPPWAYLPTTAFLGASVLGIHAFLLGTLGKYLYFALKEKPAPWWVWPLGCAGAALYLGGLVAVRFWVL